MGDILKLVNARYLFDSGLQVKKCPRFSRKQTEANNLIGEDIKNGNFPRTKKEFKKRYAEFFKKYKSWPEIDPTTSFSLGKIKSEITQEIIKKWHKEYIQDLKNMSIEELESRIRAYESRLEDPEELSCVYLDKMFICTDRKSASESLRLLKRILKERNGK